MSKDSLKAQPPDAAPNWEGESEPSEWFGPTPPFHQADACAPALGSPDQK